MSSPPPVHRRIIIIGAGLAGLGAASRLASSRLGSSFLVLEASATAGGRARTVRHEGRPLELGAQWIHGSDNALYRLAAERGLVDGATAVEGAGRFVREGGEFVDESTVREVAEEVEGILDECRKFHDRPDEAASPSVGHYLERNFIGRLRANEPDEDRRKLKIELFDWHVRFQIIDNSCRNLHELSAKWWGSYVVGSNEHYNIKGGYGALIDVIMRDVTHERVVFDCRVTAINYGESVVTVECDAGNFTCDHVIVTPSIGALDRIEFVPPIRTDPSIGFYGIGKIFLFFQEKWWGDFKGFQLLWKRDDLDLGRDLDAEDGWLRHLTGFEEVFDHPDALIGWIGGEGLRRMEELDEAQVGEACVRLLRRYLGGLLEVQVPKKVIRTRWLSDPFTGGSYCHLTPGSDSSRESPIVARSEPIVVRGVPRVFLAGEASHPTRYSTAHGAYESGTEQAERLIGYFEKGEI